MAEQEKLPNKERRARAREERKLKAEQEAKQAKKKKAITTLSTVVVLVLIGAVVVTAFTGGTDFEPIVLNSAAVDEARDAAGCEVVSDQPLIDREHFEPATAPEADAIYTGPRPTHSGSHFQSTHPIVRHGSDNQLEERATTHNLEHGSIIAWYDPEKVDSSTVDDMEDWSELLNDNGFSEARFGTAIFVSPYTDPGIASGKAVALRAWGLAIDCDEWDEDVANGFVIDRYGTHGIAPERTFAPFPEDQMSFEDREVEDNTTAPTGEGDTTGDMTPEDPTADPATEGDADESEDPQDAGTEAEGEEPTPSESPASE